MKFVEFSSKEDLVHWGKKRRSGRYPWGSGDRPRQRLEKSKKRFLTPEERMAIDENFNKNTKNKERVIYSGPKAGSATVENNESFNKKTYEDYAKEAKNEIESDTEYRQALKKNKNEQLDDISSATLDDSYKNINAASKQVGSMSKSFENTYNYMLKAKYGNKDRSKKVRELSNDELKRINERIDLNKKYNDLTMPNKSKKFNRTMAAINALEGALIFTATGLAIYSAARKIKEDAK